MSVAGNSAAAPSLRRLPFTVNAAPTFVNPIIDSTGSDLPASLGNGGLLFGVRESNSVLVRRFSSVDLRGTSSSLEALTKLATTGGDAELRSLAVIGWYSVRTSGGLLESDIEFHNRNFSKTSDLAVVVRADGPNEIIIELYSRSADGILSEEGHRWGLLRLARGKQLEESAAITMRAQMRDDFFLRAYQQPYEQGDSAAPAMWKRTLERIRGRRKEPAAEAAYVSLRAPDVVSPGPAVPQRPPVAPPPAVPQKSETPDRAMRPLPARDPSLDVTREMPRELAWKALHLVDSSATVDPAASSMVPAIANQQAPVVVRGDVAPAAAISPAAASPAPSGSRFAPWLASAALFVLAGVALFAIIRYRVLPESAVPAPAASSPLGLHLEGQGDRILVTWDRKSTNAGSAVNGQLMIDDGSQQRTVPLDTAQILNGSVLYTPASADITFRLRLNRRDGKQVEETLRVLDASRTNNERIKVISADGVQTSTPSTFPKPVASRKPAAAALPGSATIAPATPALDLKKSEPDPLAALPDSAPPASASENVAPSVPENSKSAVSKESAPPETPNETVLAAPPTAVPISSSDTAKRPEVVVPTPNPSSQITEATPQAAAPHKREMELPDTAGTRLSSLKHYSPPRPVRQVMPNLRVLAPGIAASASQVEVTVTVDQQGHVTGARLTNPAAKVNSALASAVLMAARGWTFNPATLNGQSIGSEHGIIFSFRPGSR